MILELRRYAVPSQSRHKIDKPVQIQNVNSPYVLSDARSVSHHPVTVQPTYLGQPPQMLQSHCNPLQAFQPYQPHHITSVPTNYVQVSTTNEIPSSKPVIITQSQEHNLPRHAIKDIIDSLPSFDPSNAEG